MKMRSLSAVLALLFFTIGAYAQQSKAKMTPVDYNDKLAAVTDSLYLLGTQWGTMFQEISGSDKDFSRLAAHRKIMLSFTNRKMEEIRREKGVGVGHEGLKSAMLNFLGFEKEMIEKAFSPLERLNASSSDADMETAIKNLTAEADKESAVLKMVVAAQEAYGEQNGFTIEKEESGENQ